MDLPKLSYRLNKLVKLELYGYGLSSVEFCKKEVQKVDCFRNGFSKVEFFRD